jgi:hypothetical protein
MMLYKALPAHLRYPGYEKDGNCYKVCAIQKEYPTAHKIGKSIRQNWDIAVIKTPLEIVEGTATNSSRTVIALSAQFW